MSLDIIIVRLCVPFTQSAALLYHVNLVYVEVA